MRTSRSILVPLSLALVAVLMCLTTQTAFAHPLGGAIISRYARIDQYSDVVRLTYMLDYGWQATANDLPLADTDHDRKFSSQELQAFADSVQTNYGFALRLQM